MEFARKSTVSLVGAGALYTDVRAKSGRQESLGWPGRKKERGQDVECIARGEGPDRRTG